VTHDQIEALTLGQRIVVMNEGTIQQVGTPTEVYNWPANRFVAGFIGTPSMNFIAGEITHSAGRPEFCRDAWRVPLDQRLQDDGQSVPRAATLGVRPEDVTVHRAAPNDRAAADAVVTVVEMLGDATLATLELAADGPRENEGEYPGSVPRVVCKLEPRWELTAGDRVSISVDSGRVHVFDPGSGASWTRRPAEATAEANRN
jgi:multiple sugar transport system ATP-binding protein